MQAGGSLSKWYIAQLKAYPLMTNVSSAFVLMTTGDVLAQELETQQKTDAYPTTRVRNIRRQASSWEDIEVKIASKDPIRTITMAAWSVCFHTPFYLGIFKLYNRYLPKQTPTSILARVFLSFLSSIPVNAAFYTYGTLVHHGVGWFQAQTDLRHPTHFGIEEAWEKTRIKIETELPNTMTTSASCWIPVNLLTFTFVPAHLQPVSLMCCSMFWNCYLSMSQHRDVHDSEEYTLE